MLFLLGPQDVLSLIIFYYISSFIVQGGKEKPYWAVCFYDDLLGLFGMVMSSIKCLNNFFPNLNLTNG